MNTTLSDVIAAVAITLAISGGAMAQNALTLPDASFAPEGVAIDSNGTLYTGSLTQGRLIKIDPKDGKVEAFASPGANGMVSVIGIHVSADDRLVYACSSDPGASQLTGTAAPALVAFDRETGGSAGRFELPEGGAFCNDITELPDGTILATDSFVPRIYALRPHAEELEIWLESGDFAGEGFNLNGIAYSDGTVYFVRYNTGALYGVPVNDKGAVGQHFEVALPAPLAAPDGLNALGNGRFLVVEGGGLSAGSRGKLSGIILADGKATVETIAPDLNVPTTAAVRNGVAYVVEGQLDHLFDSSAGAPDPYRILMIDLPPAYH